MLRDPLFSRFFSMEPSESKPNTKEFVEGKPVKEIAERAVSLETKASGTTRQRHKRLQPDKHCVALAR